MDNASYHNILSDTSTPTQTCSKGRILEWLGKNKFPCNPDCLKVELVETLSKYAPEPTYAIDEIANKAGHVCIERPHIIQNCSP
jgi:hypothetical protein